MKIALVGFGNMGKQLVEIVSERKQDTIVSISFSERIKKLDIAGIKKADIVIDFTSSEIVLENIKKVAQMKKPLVVGTTGWYEKLNDVKQIIKENNIGFVYGQNFSIGANIFFHIVRYSAELIDQFQFYDVYGLEIHHAKKKDSPSGTAKKISEIVLNNFSKKKVLQTEKLDRQIAEEEFHFVSVRGGENSGRHEITFDSQADAISLRHQAHNRRGFGEGALLAAEFIKEKKGFYSFDEVFENYLKK